MGETHPYFAMDVLDGEDKGVFGDWRDPESLDRAVAVLSDVLRAELERLLQNGDRSQTTVTIYRRDMTDEEVGALRDAP